MKEHDWGQRADRWAGVQSDHVTIDSTRVHLLRAGDPAAGGLPTLLVHGLGGSASNWLEVMPGLAARGPVVAVDLPGFAHTRPPTPRAARIQPQVAFLVRLLDELGWDRVELHGNSMGGLISILLAGTHPDRVARLGLTSPAFPSPVRGSVVDLDPAVAQAFAPFALHRRLGVAAIRAMYRRTEPEDLVQRTEGLVLTGGQRMPPALREVNLAHALDAQRLPWRADCLGHATKDLLSHLTTQSATMVDAAGAVRAPILLIWGEEDRLVRRSSMDALTTLRGDVRRHDLAGVGHVAMIEVPDRWLGLVTAWRADHPVAAAADDGGQARETPPAARPTDAAA